MSSMRRLPALLLGLQLLSGCVRAGFLTSNDDGGEEGGESGSLGDSSSAGDTLPAKVPAHPWAKALGAASQDEARVAAVDPAGNTVVGGCFYETIDLGGGPLVSAGRQDIYLVSLDADGKHRWSRSFGSSAVLEEPTGIAIDDSGNVVVTGIFYGPVDFGGGPLAGAGSGDIFLASFDTDGNHRWSKSFGSGATERGAGVAVDGAGNVALTGRLVSTLDFSGDKLTNRGKGDLFVATFDSAGAYRWSLQLGGADSEAGTDVAFDTRGNLIVVGTFDGTIDLGDGPVVSSGGTDGLVISCDPQGKHRWSRVLEGPGNARPTAVAVDGSDNLTVVGDYLLSLDPGGGTMTATWGYDVFIASYDAAGNPRWQRSLGGKIDDNARDVAAEADGRVYVTGKFYGPLEAGGGTLAGFGDYDAFVVSYDAAGQHRWSRQLGGPHVDDGKGVAVRNQSYVVAVGSFKGAADFLGQSLSTGGESLNGYVVSMPP
jgi:hypothetical protein